MTNEENMMKNKISFALKDPILQLGFEIICKQNEELKKENLTLKANKTKCHDLRKDPNDLPKDNGEKLCFYGKGKIVARYDNKYDCWEAYFNNFETVIPSSVIIAWCETPNFDRV